MARWGREGWCFVEFLLMLLEACWKVSVNVLDFKIGSTGYITVHAYTINLYVYIFIYIYLHRL